MPCVQTIYTAFWYRSRDISYNVIRSYHLAKYLGNGWG